MTSFEWPAAPGARGYEFSASSDEPRNALRFDTAQRGLPLAQPKFSIPGWIWELAPKGARVDWRALAVFPDERRVVARGSLVRVDPATLPVVGHDSAPRSAPVSAGVMPDPCEA